VILPYNNKSGDKIFIRIWIKINNQVLVQLLGDQEKVNSDIIILNDNR